jgi:hypothetical protein
VHLKLELRNTSYILQKLSDFLYILHCRFCSLCCVKYFLIFLLQNGELKATHIVIQNDPGGGDEASTPTSAPNTPLGLRGETVPNSWTESANMPVLPVRCKVMYLYI